MKPTAFIVWCMLFLAASASAQVTNMTNGPPGTPPIGVEITSLSQGESTMKITYLADGTFSGTMYGYEIWYIKGIWSLAGDKFCFQFSQGPRGTPIGKQICKNNGLIGNVNLEGK